MALMNSVVEAGAGKRYGFVQRLSVNMSGVGDSSESLNETAQRAAAMKKVITVDSFFVRLKPELN
jgi:hypothetical protein